MDYSKLIDSYKDEMIETLKELVSFRSVVSEGCNDAAGNLMPFGKGVQEALDYMLSKGAADGFDVENIDGYGGHIEFGGYVQDEEGNKEVVSNEVMGIIGHLDVVPEGSGWKHSPYEAVLEDGKLYGRGTIDDKGPVLAAYFAMKALKESGYIPAKKVRIILGLDEETEWKGMDYYFSKVKPPTFGFTPDADFPAIHGEKGILVFSLAKKFGKSGNNNGLELRSIKGGNAANMVPDSARAVVRSGNTKDYDNIKEKAAGYREKTGYKVFTKGVGKSFEITTEGKSAHGSTPGLGLNAVSILMDFLGNLNFASDDANEFIEFYNKYIGFELDGQSLGCSMEDAPSGKLVLNLGVIDVSPEAAELVINVRYPVTAEGDAVYASIMPLVDANGFGIVKGKDQDPIYFPADDPMIVTLMEIYKKHTGDKDSRPLVIGGGTYARACSGVVAFGPGFPGEAEMAHQKDEYIDVENWIKATKIYADAIYQLTQV